MKKGIETFAKESEFPVINRKRRGRRHEALCYSLLKSDVYTLAIPTNLTKEELVGYLRTELLKIDNEINALFLKRQKVMDTLIDFEKNIKEEIKENIPTSTAIKYKKYQEHSAVTHRGVLDLARQNFEDVDFHIFRMIESEEEVLSEDELEQPSSNVKPREKAHEPSPDNFSDKNVSFQGSTQRPQPSSQEEPAVQNNLPPDLQAKQLYTNEKGEQFVPNYVAMGIPYSVIKEFVEEKTHDEGLCRRLAKEFGLNPDSPSLESHLKEMFHFLVENKVADPLLYAIREDCKHLYKQCTVQDFMVAFN